MLTGSAITRALVIVVLAAGLAGLWQFFMPRAAGPHLSEPPKVSESPKRAEAGRSVPPAPTGEAGDPVRSVYPGRARPTRRRSARRSWRKRPPRRARCPSPHRRRSRRLPPPLPGLHPGGPLRAAAAGRGDRRRAARDRHGRPQHRQRGGTERTGRRHDRQGDRREAPLRVAGRAPVEAGAEPGDVREDQGSGDGPLGRPRRSGCRICDKNLRQDNNLSGRSVGLPRKSAQGPSDGPAVGRPRTRIPAWPEDDRTFGRSRTDRDRESAGSTAAGNRARSRAHPAPPPVRARPPRRSDSRKPLQSVLHRSDRLNQKYTRIHCKSSIRFSLFQST